LEEFEKEFELHKDDLASGPIRNRRTTDIPCCLLFILFLCGMVAIFVYGMMEGDPTRITIGWDGNSPQQGCGWNETTLDYPYLYWAKAPSRSQFETLTQSTDYVEIKEAAMAILN